MGNVSDDMQRVKLSSLVSLIQASVAMGKRIEEVVVPVGVSKAYFCGAFGDEYVRHSSGLSDVEAKRNALREAEKSYLAALDFIEKYSCSGPFSAESLELRLEYLRKNLLP